MRPVVAVLIAAAVLSTLALYMKFEQSVRREAKAVQLVGPARASGVYSLEITLSFDADADPFGGLEPASIIVRRLNEVLLRRETPVSAGETIHVDNLPGIVEGLNEFHITASPQDDDRGVARAVRVRVLRDGLPIEAAETTLWSEPGQSVSGLVKVLVEKTAPDRHEHEH